MRRTGIVFLWLTACPFFVSGQINDLLRNPDVSWVGEYTTDYVLNPEDEDSVYPPLNDLDVIQFQNPASESGLYGTRYLALYLSEQLYRHVQNPDFQCYTDSAVQQVMTRDELLKRVIVQDTAGYSICDGSLMIRNEEVRFDEVRRFRVRQIFWYNRKSRAFDGRFIAFAPVVVAKDKNGDTLGTRALYWLKAGENEPKRLKNKQFNYIFQTKTGSNAPRPADIKTLKGRLDFRELVAEEIKKPSHPRLDASEFQPISTEQLMKICYVTDTVITYDPASHEEKIAIEHRSYVDQVERIRFVQNWYYDERQNRLFCRLTGMAPLAAIRDREGVFRYYKPLFYVIYR